MYVHICIHTVHLSLSIYIYIHVYIQYILYHTSPGGALHARQLHHFAVVRRAAEEAKPANMDRFHSELELSMMLFCRVAAWVSS